MRVTADTNLLVRAVVGDDPAQTRAAGAVLRESDLVAIPTPALCEFVWVLRRKYGFKASEVAAALRQLISVPAVCADRPAVEAGIATLEAGGDFADGCIAWEGRRLGGSIFTSFDRQAVALVKAAGGDAHLLTASSPVDA